MAKQNNILLELSKEIEQYSRDIAKQLAIETRENLYKIAFKAISAFYSDYSPIYYKRHRPISYNLRKSYRKFYANPHNTIYRGGVELSSEWMDDLYRADTDYVFNLVYAGYHGNILMLPWEKEDRDGPPFGTLKNIPPIMSPSPLEIILNARDNMVKNMAYKANAIAQKVKKNGNYRYIR